MSEKFWVGSMELKDAMGVIAPGEAVDWSETMVLEPNQHVRVKASTWTPLIIFDSPRVCLQESENWADVACRSGVVSPKGTWIYLNSVVKAGTKLSVIPTEFLLDRKATKQRSQAWVSFDGDIVVPILFGPDTRPGARKHARVTWMSYIPHEIITQNPLLSVLDTEKDVSEVVVGGLGMSWFVDRVARHPRVKKITVVELSGELLDWCGMRRMAELKAEFPDKEFLLFQGDALSYLEDEAQDSRRVFLYDIWLKQDDSFFDLRFLKQVERGMRAWGWGMPFELREPGAIEPWVRYVRDERYLSVTRKERPLRPEAFVWENGKMVPAAELVVEAKCPVRRRKVRDARKK